jgi:ergothioneine biosynthesis protein EgtB
MILRPGMPSVAPASTAETVVHELASRFRDVRAVTERLAAPLSAEDCALQSMPDASPTKWHLAHTSWFFETFVLERGLPHFASFHPGFRTLFNSYYVGVGPRHPRPERGLLSRPSLDEVLAYRRHVDRAMERLFTAGLDRDLAGTVELGIHHEQQHQELILTDLKHLLSRNPLHPAYLTLSPAREASTTRALDWIAHPPGLRSIGHDAAGFCFDNETPRHRAYVAAFEIADRPVTNGEYLAFIEDKGYARPELWLAEGWDTRAAHDWRAPLYWLQDADDWFSFTVNGLQPLDPAEPVAHVSYYEADAYARWTGARLPTEHEWETLATSCPVDGHFLESGRWHPRAALCERDGAVQVYGDVWEWTGSAYSPYPGYRPMAGAIGEYNGKFMVNQYVLRGGSCATPRSHIRATYRNFFPAAARWQFSGIRLARDRD